MTHSLDFVEDFNPDSDKNCDRLLYKTLYLYWHLKRWTVKIIETLKMSLKMW